MKNDVVKRNVFCLVPSTSKQKNKRLQYWITIDYGLWNVDYSRMYKVAGIRTLGSGMWKAE